MKNMPKVDNYIKFLNAFYVWEQQNQLTAIQECILMRILRRVNASGWCEWIKVSNLELMFELHITSEVTFRNNRNRLMELGLIEYKAGKKGKPSSYKLNMPTKKEIVYKFSKSKYVENSSENINVKSNVNNAEAPHEQCISDTPKHKTINNKLKDKVNTNVFTHRKNSCDDVLSLYNNICLELSKVIKLSDKRKKQINKMFCLGYSLEDFKKVFENTQKSTFLSGKANNCSWKANFDWLIKEDNFLKVLEGNYQYVVKENEEANPKTDTTTNISDWI